MKYTELKKKHRELFENFPMAFAFSKKQMNESMKLLGVKSTEPLVSIGGGGFIRKADKEKFLKMLDQIDKELEQATKDDDFLVEAIEYELANTEYCVTNDPEQALATLGVSLEDERTRRLFEIAKKNYWKNVVL